MNNLLLRTESCCEQNQVEGRKMHRDETISYLNRLGYSVINLPRENVDPLLVLSRSNGYVEILGEISHFVAGNYRKPRIRRDELAAQILNLKSDTIELGVGLKLLERFFSLIGAAGIGLETCFRNADSLQFVYQNVRIDSVFPAAVGKYLSNVSPDMNSSFFEDIKDKDEAYVITETLKSNSFGVAVYDERGMGLNMDITTLRQLLSATPNIKLSTNGKNVILFRGDRFLRFAFKAIVVWIEVKNGEARFRLNKPGKPIQPLRYSSSSFFDLGEPTPVVLGRNRLIELK